MTAVRSIGAAKAFAPRAKETRPTFFYSNSGTLTRGNIQIHTASSSDERCRTRRNVRRNQRCEGKRPIRVIRLAGAFDGLGPRAKTAGSARPTLPAAFASQPRRLGEPYSAHSLGCEFSGGTIRSRSESSRLEARVVSWGLALENLVRGVPSSDFARCSLENLQ